MKLLLITIALILLTSCSGEKKLMNSWIGNNKHDLVLSWGPSERIASDGSNGEVYIYERQYVYYNAVRYNHRMFYIDNSGIIYSWRTRSGPVPATQVDVNLYVH